MPFVAREIGDEIVLTGSFAANVETQWIFSNITAESFSWRNQTRTRLDARWSIGQTFAATRSS